jgi:hypothetical protein
MVDLLELLSRPAASMVLGILRALWWLSWDFFVQTVSWSIGWLILRTLTMGHFPPERLGNIDEAHWLHRLVVDLTGLAVLAMGIWWLSGKWPQI